MTKQTTIVVIGSLRVKFCFKDFRTTLFQTIGWILFIYSMMINIGPRFYAVSSHPST